MSSPRSSPRPVSVPVKPTVPSGLGSTGTESSLPSLTSRPTAPTASPINRNSGFSYNVRKSQLIKSVGVLGTPQTPENNSGPPPPSSQDSKRKAPPALVSRSFQKLSPPQLLHRQNQTSLPLQQSRLNPLTQQQRQPQPTQQAPPKEEAPSHTLDQVHNETQGKENQGKEANNNENAVTEESKKDNRAEEGGKKGRSIKKSKSRVHNRKTSKKADFKKSKSSIEGRTRPPKAKASKQSEDFERILAHISSSPKELEAITKFQKIFRKSRILRLLQTLVYAYKKSPNSQRERHRFEVEREIIATERTYLISLYQLITKYLIPLRGQSFAKENDLRSIFSNVEVLYQCNLQILSGLDPNNKTIAITKVGLIFRQFSPYLKLYTQYVSNYGNAIGTIERLKKNKKISAFLEECREKTPSNLDMNSMLIQPVQRIPRYVLLLQELFKYTSEEHVDYQNITAALADLKSVAATVNETRRKYEQMSKVVEIQQSISGNFMNLVEPHRICLRDGDLTLSGVSDIAFSYHFFLFNDMILYAKATKSLVTYTYEGNILLHSATLDEDPNETSLRILPNATSTGGVILTFSSEKEKTLWKTDILASIAKLSETRQQLPQQDEMSPLGQTSNSANPSESGGSKSGVLHKKVLLGRWQPYYFDLKGSILMYSSNQEPSKSKSAQTLNVKDFVLHKEVEQGKRPYAFKLTQTRGTDLVLSASSFQDYNAWLDLLSPVVSSAVKN
eukprot:TRINITY_DN12446_c0_g1_i1.p1 TRINITY_DN12446_c0_g1~~TRINITY_DN12446_c0_g1_i1.p1  ORF type:complete len:776 (+),score=181.15 TRINITY_DN12446_c0_g1_i1:136-2328(+)